jgi:hypothetical protein
MTLKVGDFALSNFPPGRDSGVTNPLCLVLLRPNKSGYAFCITDANTYDNKDLHRYIPRDHEYRSIRMSSWGNELSNLKELSIGDIFDIISNNQVRDELKNDFYKWVLKSFRERFGTLPIKSSVNLEVPDRLTESLKKTSTTESTTVASSKPGTVWVDADLGNKLVRIL